jgi:hypothetical protein
MGAMLFSNNIEPVPMLKVNELEPIDLPGLLEHLGPVRVQVFFGKLAGRANLEVGFSRTTVTFGQGIPCTLRNMFATYFSVSESGCCILVNARHFPGDRKGGLDFSYRLPHLRKRLTIYTESLRTITPHDGDSSLIFGLGRGLSGRIRTGGLYSRTGILTPG